jgi:hypothetical protein
MPVLLTAVETANGESLVITAAPLGDAYGFYTRVADL